MPDDHLDIWRPMVDGKVPAAIQIDQADGVSAAVHYWAEDAVTIARAILEAVGIDPAEAFNSGAA